MRQLIVYTGWFGIVLMAVSLVLMLRRPFPSTQPRQVYVGQLIGAVASILLGLALTQFNNINWFSWFCVVFGGILAIISFVVILLGRRQV